MGKKQRQPAALTGDPRAAKKTKEAQPGIAAAFAAASAAPRPASADLVLQQAVQRELLGQIEELAIEGDKYLTAWSDKCYALRDGAPASAATPGSAQGRRASALAYSKADADLDLAALRYLELFRHLQQQAFKQGAAFEARHLEVLVLILRSDVIHALGDVSHLAYTLLDGYLRRFPYASVGQQQGGQHDGRPILLLDEKAAWEPLKAIANLRGVSKKYIFEEAIKDGGHNYKLDRGSSSLMSASYKKGGQLASCFALLKLCFERAADSVEEDHNGDVLLLRYLLDLLQQDLRARLAVFHAYADLGELAQGKRAALLQNSLLWRIWLDDQETDVTRRELVRLLMRLIVGVASEKELQEVEEEHMQLDKDAELASPCVCTPRELAALAATLLNMLLDLFGEAEAAGGFCSTAANRMHRKNARLRLDQAMKELFWKGSDGVCRTEDMSRTFLAALAPAHRLRLLSLVAVARVSRAYTEMEAARVPVLTRAKQLDGLVEAADSGDFGAAFGADPVLALQCLNHDKNRSIKLFTHASQDRGIINNLTVLVSGIVLAAHTLVAAGAPLPACTGAAHNGAGGSAEGVKRLQQEARQFMAFLTDKHREFQGGEKKERALELSRESLFGLLHAHAGIAAF